MPDFTPESGAELRVLRPAKFVPADETLFNEKTQKFVDATGIPVKVDYQAWEDLRPQTAVPANTGAGPDVVHGRSEEDTSDLQSLMRLSYAAYCVQTKNQIT